MIRSLKRFAYILLSLFILWFGKNYFQNSIQSLHDESEATVTGITAQNSTCSGYRSSRNCTQFYLDVVFQNPRNFTYNEVVEGDHEYGWDMPISSSMYKVGDVITVTYDPNNTANIARKREMWSRWLKLFGLFVALALTTYIAIYHPDKSNSKRRPISKMSDL